MEKSIFLIVVIFIALFCGCGQALKVTVYNATGNSSYGGGWTAIDISTEGSSQWFIASSSALTETECDSTNSITIEVKENETLDIGGNGEYSTDGTPATLTPFDLPTGNKVLYGGLLEQPHWYAAVNMESVVFYKK